MDEIEIEIEIKQIIIITIRIGREGERPEKYVILKKG